MIYEGFLKAYKAWREKADADQSWAESHPLKIKGPDRIGHAQVPGIYRLLQYADSRSAFHIT